MNTWRRARTVSLLWLCSLAFAQTSCRTTPSPTGSALRDAADGTWPSPVQMNDVSVLYPAPSTPADVANYLAPSASGPNGVLLPQSMAVPDITTVQDHGVDATAAYNKLRLVAFRLDPCFANADPAGNSANCQAQIRLVFEDMTVTPIGGSDIFNAGDFAVHAFYALTKEQFKQAVTDMINLRLDPANAVPELGSDLGPLQAHPIMAKQGMSGTFAAALNGQGGFILKYAGASNLIRIAALARQGFQFSAWVFTATDFDANGAPLSTKIPALSPDAAVQKMSTSTSTPAPANCSMKAFPLHPTPASQFSAALDPMIATPAASSTAQLQTAYDTMLTVENPDLETVNDADCASCHSTPFARRMASCFTLAPSAPADQFSPDSGIPGGDVINTTTLPQPGLIQLDFHFFSYFGATPTIAQRTINETASIVALLNEGAF